MLSTKFGYVQCEYKKSFMHGTQKVKKICKYSDAIDNKKICLN